jgi:hypothetical protein
MFHASVFHTPHYIISLMLFRVVLIALGLVVLAWMLGALLRRLRGRMR